MMALRDYVQYICLTVFLFLAYNSFITAMRKTVCLAGDAQEVLPLIGNRIAAADGNSLLSF